MVMKVTVSRTGYTGEDGVEAILPATMVGMAMKMLLKDVAMGTPDAVLKPCGLGARDTLRIEAGMPLYGHELGEGILATACGVDFAIALDKDQGDKGEPFIGMAHLKKVAAEGGPRHKLVGIEIEGRRAARQGMTVKHGDKEVGNVSSGCLSPTLGKSIAMAFVDRGLTAIGTSLQVESGKGATFEGKIVPLPFYKLPKP
jgi:aminomethyltransferase